MAVFLDTRKRILFPRWRDIYDPSSSIVLKTEKSGRYLDSYSEGIFQEKKDEFQTDPSFSNALEVVNSAFSIGWESKAIEEIKFINSLKRNLPGGLAKVIDQLLGQDAPIIDISEIKDPLLSNIFIESGKKISTLRKRISKFYYNPLLWLELSRLYSILGSLRKAEVAAQFALRLSENSNRYITRSVSRFYVHKKDFQQAQYIIRKSPLFKNDPWLIASDISYSQLMERRPSSLKLGEKIVGSKDFSNADISELASSIATEQYLKNNLGEGNYFFDISLRAPNDNSFAQAESFLKHIENREKFMNEIPNNFEAQAIQFSNEKRFEDSFKQSSRWLIDQPFSRRASYFNSYLLCSQLENYEKAIEYGKFSLQSNSDSFLLNNNMAYSYARLNDTKKAKQYLKRMKQLDVNENEKVVLLATEGIIKYREHKLDHGKTLYEDAIRQAEKIKNPTLAALAFLNFTREEFLSNEITKEEVFKIIIQFEKEDIKAEQIKNEIRKLKKILD